MRVLYNTEEQLANSNLHKSRKLKSITTCSICNQSDLYLWSKQLW